MVGRSNLSPQEHERQVKELAKLLAEGQRVQLVERVKTLTYDTAKLQEFLLGLRTESDRALPIVLFAFIEDQLHDLLLKVLNPDMPGGPEQLFESLGPLATASARIKVAAALGWLDKGTAHGLELLRKIRNEFAHYPFTKGFDDQRVRGFMSSMEPFEATWFKGMDDALRDPATLPRRLLYHARAAFLVQRMIQELLTAPLAKNMGMHPMTALRHGKDEAGKYPVVLNDLSMVAAVVIIFLMGTPEAIADYESSRKRDTSNEPPSI